MASESETQLLTRRLAHYRHLLDDISAAPGDRSFVTMWRPDRDPEFHTLTFGKFLLLAQRFACFGDNGVGPRETAVLIMPQGAELMAAFVGALLLGAVPTILTYPTFKIDDTMSRMLETAVHLGTPKDFGRVMSILAA